MILQYIIYVLFGLAGLFIVISCGFLIAKLLINKLSKENPFIEEGVTLLQQHKYDEAITQFNKALEIKELSPDALYGLGKTYERKGNIDKAVEYYKKTIAVRERYPSAYHDLGFIYQFRGEFDTAIDYYEKAIKQKRKFLESHINIGNIYLEQGKIQEALEKFDDAMFLDPKYVNAYTSTIDVFFRLESYEDALEMCNRLLKQVPGNTDGYFCKAVAQYFLNQLDEMEATKEKLAEMNPIAANDFDQFLEGHKKFKEEQLHNLQEEAKREMAAPPKKFFGSDAPPPIIKETEGVKEEEIKEPEPPKQQEFKHTKESDFDIGSDDDFHLA